MIRPPKTEAKYCRLGSLLRTSASAAPVLVAPFGVFKQSGNGREWGDHALGEFLEAKAVLGYPPPPPKAAA